MKRYIAYSLICFFAYFFPLHVDAGSHISVRFITSGNCSICKDRIENAVKTLSCIDFVFWEQNNQVTDVSFDQSNIDIYTIMKKIAEVGDDTEWYRSSDIVYNELPSCCKYKRVIDYSNVKIGYLSLMDLWVSVDDTKNNDSHISISPNVIINGTLNITNSGKNLNNFNVDIYSLDGIHVYSKNINSFTESRMDISSIPKGYFIVILSDMKGIVYTSKILLL